MPSDSKPSLIFAVSIFNSLVIIWAFDVLTHRPITNSLEGGALYFDDLENRSVGFFENLWIVTVESIRRWVAFGRRGQLPAPPSLVCVQTLSLESLHLGTLKRTWLQGWRPHLHHHAVLLVLLTLTRLLHGIHHISDLAHQLSLRCIILVIASLDTCGILLGLAFLLLLTSRANLLATLLVQKGIELAKLLLSNQLLLADLLFCLRGGNLLLLKHLKLVVVVTELLPLNDLFLDYLGHLDRHSVDTLGISLDVPLLLLVVGSWAEDVADVLSGLNRVLLILSLSEVELLFKVAILHLHRILLLVELHLLAILRVHIVRHLLTGLSLLHAISLLAKRILVVALHLFVANLLLVVGIFVRVLNALDVNELLDVALLRL